MEDEGWRHRVIEFARFAAAGTVASIFAFVLFNMLVHWSPGMGEPPLHHHAIAGFLLANIASTILTYGLSRSWAFRHRVPVGLAGGVFTFLGISLASLAIPVAALWISRNILGLSTALSDNLAANVVGLFVGFLARFYAFRIFVFQRPIRPRIAVALSECEDAY